MTETRFARPTITRVLTILLIAAIVVVGQGSMTTSAANAAGVSSIRPHITSVVIQRVGGQENVDVDVSLTLSGFAANKVITLDVTASTLDNGLLPESVGTVTSTVVTDANGDASDEYEVESLGLIAETPGTMNTVLAICAALDTTGVTLAVGEDNSTTTSS